MVPCLFEELDWKKEHSDESVAHDDHDITSTERGTTSDEKEFFFFENISTTSYDN
jgi:hypothetical protein